MTDKIKFRPIETAPRDGTNVLLKDTMGEMVSAWYCPATQIPCHEAFSGYEDDGGCWVCCDDMFTAPVEEYRDPDTGKMTYWDGNWVGWLPLDAFEL